MKNRILLLILLLTALNGLSYAQLTDENNKKIVERLIQEVKDNQIEKIAQRIHYPMARRYPLPAVKNITQFIQSYDTLIGDSLRQLIINSHVDTDWSAVGWRGIMLYNGDLWLDTEGYIIAINLQSIAEQNAWKQAVALNKMHLYPGLRDFKYPVLYMETKKFKIRIDDLGDDHYRYASWSVNKDPSIDKPDLVLTNGTRVPDGSGGNHYYEFKNGNYSYQCYINVLGTGDGTTAELMVFDGEKEILSQPAIRFEGK